MAAMTINIPDDKIAEIIADICLVYKYDISKLEGETQAQFAKRMVRNIVKDALVNIHSTADNMTDPYSGVSVT